MDLKEIRGSINAIDDEMKMLFDKRLLCSKDVATVKMEMNDSVFKPIREKEVLARFDDEEARWYQIYVRKVIQISRKYQYGQFYSAGIVDPGYVELLGEQGEKILRQGGTLHISLTEDETSETGLSKYEIISLLGDTKLEIDNLLVKGHNISFDLQIPAESMSANEDMDVNKKATFVSEARILCYMLYKETNDFCVK